MLLDGSLYSWISDEDVQATLAMGLMREDMFGPLGGPQRHYGANKAEYDKHGFTYWTNRMHPKRPKPYACSDHVDQECVPFVGGHIVLFEED